TLLQEVAALKVRTENEVIGSGNLENDIKSGRGGIREIEFFTQAHQLIHAVKNPFLQTHSVFEALNQLARYELISNSESEFLRKTYAFYREVENLIQMAEERQTHMLPDDPVARGRIAHYLGFPSTADFNEYLARQ